VYGCTLMSIFDEFKKNVPTRFMNMTTHDFKELICEFFNESGYQVRTIKPPDNVGADIFLKKGELRIVTRVKKCTRGNLVDVEEINQLTQARKHHKCHKALFVATSDFTKPIRTVAEQKDVDLWDLDRLYAETKKTYLPALERSKRCLEASKRCLEAIEKAYALDVGNVSKRIEVFDKAVRLVLAKKEGKETYDDMVRSASCVDNYGRTVNERIVGLMTDLARLYENEYQFPKAKWVLQQALELDQGSYVAAKAMNDILLKQGNIDGAIELWKEKIRNRLTADKQWLKDAQKKKRECYSFHPKPSTIEQLKTLVDQGIIPKEQYHYRKGNIIERQRRAQLDKIAASDSKERKVEVRKLHKYYCIEDVSVLHKDCYDLSCRRVVGKKPGPQEEIPVPNSYPGYGGLTPEQRWIYHDWLQNKAIMVDIGYVFLRLAELIEMLFHENYDKVKVRNEIKFLCEAYRHDGGVPSYTLEALRLSYFVEQKQFPQQILDSSSGPWVSVLFFNSCGLDYRWGKEVPQKLKTYLHKLLDKYREEGDFCKLISYRLAETYYASEECEKALLAVRTISKPRYSFMPIEIAIETRYKLNESLEGYELLAAAGINNSYYYYANGKKITERVEGHTGEGDWIQVANPVKTEITYHFSKFATEHFDVIATRCERKLRKWEESQGQNLLQYTAEVYDKDPSFTSSGNNFMFAKEFMEPVAKIAYEAENEIREAMDYPSIGKPSLTETRLYQLAKSVFKGYEVIRHARPSFLQRQHLDIYIPELKLAIEYQGEQHFKPIDFWGGIEALEASQRRDEKKRKRCENYGIRVVYFNYEDEVSDELLRDRLKDYL